MTLKAENLAIVILLDELDLQCQLAQKAIEWLRTAAEAWKNNVASEGKPLDIIANCIVCLSASAAIHRLLEPGDRKGKRAALTERRCRAVRRVLHYPALVQVKKQGTRNSWEHMDERLDTVFSQGKCLSFAPVHLSPRAPNPGTFVHHHFDPANMAIKHGIDSIELNELYKECDALREAIKFANLSLATGADAPYLRND